MRVETQKACNAMLNNREKNYGNTKVHFDKNGVAIMTLFGNKIAELSSDKKELRVTNHGWFSLTTKERLNGLFNFFDVDYGIQQIKGKWFLNKYQYNPTFKVLEQKQWDGNWITFHIKSDK